MADTASTTRASNLSWLHPGHISDSTQIRHILERAWSAGSELRSGFNKRIEPETAVISAVGDASLVLRTSALKRASQDRLLLSFSVDGEPFIFETSVIRLLADDEIEAEIPTVLYHKERRARDRKHDRSPPGLRIEHKGSRFIESELQDVSSEGMAVEIPSELAVGIEPHSELVIRGMREVEGWSGNVRSVVPSRRSGWVRIGLDLSPVPSSTLNRMSIKSFEQRGSIQRIGGALKVARGGAGVALDRFRRWVGNPRPVEHLQLVEFSDFHGRTLRGVIDSWGNPRDAVAVVIPPAWGRAKETLMPLAQTLVACFQGAEFPIVVLRFDGINKRGESYRAPECMVDGREHFRFTFSQGVDDIHSAVRYLREELGVRPKRTFLVSFSASSIEARRAVVENADIDGWICVVGSADLQSMMRAISGGTDFALGLERGVRFGFQEILGVTVDMDLAGSDALKHRLVYLSDARRDMSLINVPVTWISGRFDAWMDAERAQDILSRGDASKRRFIEVPTGHMLRSSQEALRVFQLIAREIGSFRGLEIPAAMPDLARIERRRVAELARLPTKRRDLRQFWSDYLLGRDRSIGFELMTLTSAYAELMRLQIRGLSLIDGDRVLDVGSGTGAFSFYRNQLNDGPRDVQVIAIDVVREGLKRARMRLASTSLESFVEANIRSGSLLPVCSGSVNAVLGSLLLSYLMDATYALSEMHRVLRPGGRIVVSSLSPDADMSKLFDDGVRELRARWESGELEQFARGIDFDSATRAYMNEASRLLELEDQAVFRFFDEEELVGLVESQGFVGVAVERSFGSPPQAVIVSARRSLS